MVFNAVDKTAFWILVGFFQVGYWIWFGFSAFRLRILLVYFIQILDSSWFFGLSARIWVVFFSWILDRVWFFAFRLFGFGSVFSIRYWICFWFS